MFDERWSDETREVSSALRSLLEGTCDEPAVRAAESSADGRSREVEQHLREFGLHDLPAEPELLAAVSVELGRSLAPVPWVELTAVRILLDVEDAVYALESDPPAGPGSAVVATASGIGLVANQGERERTAAGDFLVRVDRGLAEQRWGEEDAQKLRALTHMLAAARVSGAASKLVEIGVTYAKERQAFGRSIGSYQAVAHKLADAATAAEGLELIVKKTAWLAARDGANGVPQPIFGLMTWSHAVEVGRLVARNVHQCMAGFGATLESPAQLYSRRLRSWALRLGRPGDAHREIARILLTPQRRDAVEGLWHEERGVTVPRWARELDVTV
ncbi:acyl-CoA dehydrogenase family protein [Pseudonocardia sp. N23]|uniref:acyl-CoA dehydrogenase family protein n=1 Tax=Pseudonocardia sp. N23 TaxID=1987376 RepID=UPI000BFE9DEE|nr:acyl-CoA dehydrogenase family protein [Pseudonocardia sp. N23]GAY10854.1 butyryl-CoA dehydrogenase [Pseudonocardia sp. N23]